MAVLPIPDGTTALWSLGNLKNIFQGSCYQSPLSPNAKKKIWVWRQLLAKEESQVKFFVWRPNVTSGLKLSHCLVPLNGHQCISKLSINTPNYRPHNSVADRVKPGHVLLTYGDRHTLLTTATGNGQKTDRPKYTWCHTVHEINCTTTRTSLSIVVNNNSH